MKKILKQDLHKAYQIIEDIIQTSENVKIKFQEGTSQSSLLLNRIHAMRVVRTCMNHELNLVDENVFTSVELQKAIAPIQSIHHKCSKAMTNMKVESYQYRRLQSMVEAMNIATILVQQQIDEKSES